MSRRSAGIIGAVLAIAAAGTLTGHTTADAQVAAAPPGGPLVGAYSFPRGGETMQQAAERLERDLGAKLPVIRDYSTFGKRFDVPFHRWAVDGGRTMLISFKARRVNGTDLSWRSIADAAPGSTIHNEILAMADSAKAIQAPMVLVFHHEPESKANLGYGTSTDFVDAWRRIVTDFRSRGVTNVKWAWTMTSWSFSVKPTDRRASDKWYPGDDYVDYIGADPYNWNQCRGYAQETWRSLAQLIAPMMTFAAKHPTKKLALPEFGSAEGAPGDKAAWLADAATLLKTSPYAEKFAVVTYFHNEHLGTPACAWWLDSSPATMAAAGALVSDSTFRNTGALA